MKKRGYVGLLLIILLSLSACGAPLYTVELKDGREYISHGEPKINEYGWVIFTTSAGKKVRLKLDEVLVISEN